MPPSGLRYGHHRYLQKEDRASRNRLIGIAVGCTVVVLVVVIAMAGGPTPPAEANSRDPSFLEVGRVYYAATAAESHGRRNLYFRVLEIIEDEWILAEMELGAPQEYRYEAWLNTSQLIVVWHVVEIAP